MYDPVIPSPGVPGEGEDAVDVVATIREVADIHAVMNQSTFRALLLLAAILSFASTTPAQPATQPATSRPAAAGGRSMKDAIGLAPKHAGFAMDGYFIWCSSVLKVGDTYHMFASRWPAEKGLNGWTTLSECVRATSKDLLGPYKFEEVVLQKREGSWDSERVHNPKIVRAGDKFVLYYISTANETGYAVADSVTGLWTRSDKVAMNFSNPAPLARKDGSIYCFGRKSVNNVRVAQAFAAPAYEGPYKLVNDGSNLLPDGCELEDPTIWWARDQYNVLVTDFGPGRATGIVKAGAQYFSKDGVRYQLLSNEPVFTKTVQFDDGTSETFARRERPFVYADEDGRIIALFTACMPKDGAARVIVQPVDHYTPDN